MALETNDQYDFFRQVQLDNDGNLLVSIVNLTGATGDNYYTTAATLNGTIISFDRNDLADAYSVDLSGITVTGDYLPLSGGTLTGDLGIAANLNISGLTTAYFDCGVAVDGSYYNTLDGGAADTLAYDYSVDNGTVALAINPPREFPYKIDRANPGSAYTFSDNINTLSISSLNQATSVKLPKNPKFSFYIVKDKTGNAGLYPITVYADDNKTINGEENFIININTKPSITFLWDGFEYVTI